MKRQFLEKIFKNDKALAKLIEKERERQRSNEVRDEKRGITSDATEM